VWFSVPRPIAGRFNLDLTENPPPTPVEPGRAVGRWTCSNVPEILTNPKYTGHMVWNRHARKGAGHNRLNPPGQWVWSPESGRWAAPSASRRSSPRWSARPSTCRWRAC